MGNSNNKKSVLIANSNHLIDLLNIQGRENLLSQHQISSKIDDLSKQISILKAELERSSVNTKTRYRPKSEYLASKYKRQEGQIGMKKPYRAYSIKNACINPDFLSGSITSE